VKGRASARTTPPEPAVQTPSTDAERGTTAAAARPRRSAAGDASRTAPPARTSAPGDDASRDAPPARRSAATDASPVTPPASARRASKDALFDALASMARALASGRRAEIVEILAQGERTVEEVAAELEQSLANTSHHLRTLARAGLVVSRRSGTHVHYRLASDRVASAWHALRDLAAEHVDDLDALASAYLGDRAELATITREELQARLTGGEVVLLDVRPPVEFAAGHLPGAVSVPPDRLDDALRELLPALPADREVVAYCRGPYCVHADDAVRWLRDHGREAVRLEDGLPEWRLAGGPLEAATG
jgi:rhodanese-related sulfurtransferase